MILDRQQREVVALSIQETADRHDWLIYAVNVRTNHVHVVVGGSVAPEEILSSFKANATRAMRQTGSWAGDYRPWSAGGSKRYLWSEDSVRRAIEYVNNQDHHS